MKMEGHSTKFQGVKQNTNREQLELVRIRMDDSINKLVQEEKRLSVRLKLKERSICFLVFLSRVDFNNRGPCMNPQSHYPSHLLKHTGNSTGPTVRLQYCWSFLLWTMKLPITRSMTKKNTNSPLEDPIAPTSFKVDGQCTDQAIRKEPKPLKMYSKQKGK